MSKPKEFLPGIALVALVAGLAHLLGVEAGLARHGASPLVLAILLGAVAGNLFPQLPGKSRQAGVLLAQRVFLRVGVALFGFNLSLQQAVQVGLPGLLVDVLLVASTLALGWLLGVRWLGLDRHTALLTAAGSAICGAAAVVATVPVLRAESEKTSAAVGTVVLYGTLAMFLYPLLQRWLGMEPRLFGIYVGSTVHEVAQVIAIGQGLGDEAVRSAVVVKMLRVFLLVPFLLGLSILAARGERRGTISVPWFAIAFVALAGINSLQVLPPALVDVLRQVGGLLLAAAMAALGLETTWGKIRRAGVGPLILGLGLFVHLVVVGGILNWLLAGR